MKQEDVPPAQRLSLRTQQALAVLYVCYVTSVLVASVLFGAQFMHWVFLSVSFTTFGGTLKVLGRWFTILFGAVILALFWLFWGVRLRPELGSDTLGLILNALLAAMMAMGTGAFIHWLVKGPREENQPTQ